MSIKSHEDNLEVYFLVVQTVVAIQLQIAHQKIS